MNELYVCMKFEILADKKGKRRGPDHLVDELHEMVSHVESKLVRRGFTLKKAYIWGAHYDGARE